MDDADFDDLLDDYLSGKVAPNLDMLDVEMVWVRGNPEIGSDHIAQHGVAEKEVDPERTIFWGATRKGRWLFVSGVDWHEGHKRFLKPITAFEPEEGEVYWREQ
jgi:hypothetical protein